MTPAEEDLAAKQARFKELEAALPEARAQMRVDNLRRRQERLIARIEVLVMGDPAEALVSLGAMRELIFWYEEPARVILEHELLRKAILEAQEIAKVTAQFGNGTFP